MIAYDLDDLYSCNFHIDYIILSNIIFLKNDIKNIALNYGPIEINNKLIKNSSINYLDEAINFYQNLNVEFADIILSIYNDENTSYKVVKNVKEERKKLPNVLGMTSYNSKNNIYEIQIKKNKTIEMYDTINHEFGHLIGQFYKNKYNINENNMFSEIESIFLSLLSLYYAQNNSSLNTEANKLLIANYYNWFIEKTYILNNKINELDKFKKLYKNEIITEDNIRKLFLKNKCKLQIELFENNCFYFIKYYIARLISFELYNVYQKNPKAALELYKKIICINGKSEKEIYNKIKYEGLNPSYKSINDFVKTLKR